MKLFISYSRDDKAWVYELWRQIRDELHHDAWIDRRIVPAVDWWDAILTNIETCECFIYVMTPKSVESIYCQAELDYALALNRPILPLMLKSVDNPPPLRKRNIQYQVITDEMNLDRVLLKITMGLMAINQQKNTGKYKERSATRPSVPKPQQDPDQVFETFAMAEEAAAENNITLAEELFGQVIEADPEGLGMAAKERMQEILSDRDRAKAYANVKRLAANKVTLRGAWAAWKAFQRQYPNYDPDNLADEIQQKLNNAQRPVSQVKPQARTSSRSKALEILPAPFAWIDIPAGQVTLEEDYHDEGYLTKGQSKTFDVARFQMAKYPITNAQYAIFLDADGYSNPAYWTDAGWQAREKEDWTEPRQWQDSQFKGSKQPVVGVSWYEVYAFTQWLSEVTGEKITLPTEQQWQRAAQGDEGFVYPWGNEWDGSRCQNSVGGDLGSAGSTTPVTQYEGKGDSPFGVVDMAGNVWEWCLTSFDSGTQDSSGTERRVLRGGSWRYDDATDFRAAFRNGDRPDLRNGSVGFRCARLYT